MCTSETTHMQTKYLPLTKAEIQTLIVLYLVQPATVRLILTTLDQKPTGSVHALTSLVDRQLVRREHKPRKKIARNDPIRESPFFRPRIGKIPYVYELTTRGYAVAEALTQADFALQDEDACARQASM